MKRVKLWVQVDDLDVALAFTWDPEEEAWICKMEDDFMQELGPLPFEKDEHD